MDSPQKLSPVEKALVDNHICPHNNGNGKCGAMVISYQILGKKGSANGQSILLTCIKNHIWQVPLVEEETAK